MAGLSCLIQHLLSGPLSVLRNDNHHCMDPCIEPTYTSFVYARKKLTEIQVKSLNVPLVIGKQLVKDLNISEWIKRNIILLHIDFESDTFEAMKEIQLFTFIDLLRMGSFGMTTSAVPIRLIRLDAAVLAQVRYVPSSASRTRAEKICSPSMLDVEKILLLLVACPISSLAANLHMLKWAKAPLTAKSLR
uniref:Uncharacterized protein n=1 Tax=Romanomermis culicivorax TaxID=13658 RepID=A0A915I0M4_ROMCU